MAFSWTCVELLTLLAAVLVNADLTLDCFSDGLVMVWTEPRAQRDPSMLMLGRCYPNSVSETEAVFSVAFDDCEFRRKVTKDELEYSIELTDKSSHGTKSAFSHLVSCSQERPHGWAPPLFDPSLLHTYGGNGLGFTMELMNDDFSGPALSTSFALGSLIRIKAGVAQLYHQPLLLLLDECIATHTPDLRPESKLYPLISNHGCLMDGKVARSRFEPREDSWEMRMSLQAFKFALGEEVYIHCTMDAADPSALDRTKKACHVMGNRWELLDDPSSSGLCSCCDSSCSGRDTRSASSGGEKHTAVLGPITVVD